MQRASLLDSKITNSPSVQPCCWPSTPIKRVVGAVAFDNPEIRRYAKHCVTAASVPSFGKSSQQRSTKMHCTADKLCADDKVIHFMRHGITEMNMYLAYHDHEDPDFEDPLMYDTRLTRRGAEEAMRISCAMHKLQPQPELLVISPLTRTLETAENAFCTVDVPTLIQPLCCERLYHSSDVGRHPSVLQEEFPQYDFMHLPDVWWYNAGSEDHLAIAYEPDEVFEARVEAFRLWLASRPERCIAVVTHHGFLLNLTGANFRNCELRSVLLSNLEPDLPASITSSLSTMSLVAAEAEAVAESQAVEVDVLDVLLEDHL